jgi:hypothetical protein
MPMVENHLHKRLRASNIPEPLVTPTGPSDFDASAAVAISLQNDIYASFKKVTPRLLLSSPAATKAYEAKIPGLKNALFDVRKS